MKNKHSFFICENDRSRFINATDLLPRRDNEEWHCTCQVEKKATNMTDQLQKQEGKIKQQ